MTLCSFIEIGILQLCGILLVAAPVSDIIGIPN